MAKDNKKRAPRAGKRVGHMRRKNCWKKRVKLTGLGPLVSVSDHLLDFTRISWDVLSDTYVPLKCQDLRYLADMEKVAGLNWAIAKVIKEIRESKNLTQAQLAGFAGLSDVYIAKMEQGVRGDSLNAIVLLAAALGISPSELMQKIEVELASNPQKPNAAHGRPRQCCRQAQKKKAV